AGKCNHAFLMRSLDLHRNVVTFQKQGCMTLSEQQPTFHDVHFDSAILPICKQITDCHFPGLEACKHFRSLMKINGLAVVRIDETEVPGFRSLLKVSYTWRRKFD